MTRREIYDVLHRMLDNYMGATEDVSIWDSPTSPINIDKATEILYDAMHEE